MPFYVSENKFSKDLQTSSQKPKKVCGCFCLCQEIFFRTEFFFVRPQMAPRDSYITFYCFHFSKKPTTDDSTASVFFWAQRKQKSLINQSWWENVHFILSSLFFIAVILIAAQKSCQFQFSQKDPSLVEVFHEIFFLFSHSISISHWKLSTWPRFAF